MIWKHSILSKLEPHLKELGKEKQQQKLNLKQIFCALIIYIMIQFICLHTVLLGNYKGGTGSYGGKVIRT